MNIFPLRWLFFMFLLVSASLGDHELRAQNTPKASSFQPNPLPQNGLFSAKNNVGVLAEGMHSFSLNHILQNGNKYFLPVDDNIPQFGKGKPAHWLWAAVKNPTDRYQEFVAEIDYPYLFSVQFFLTDTARNLLTESLDQGLFNRQSNGEIPYRNPLIRFGLSPGATNWLFIRAHSGPYRLSVPLRVWTASQYSEQDRAGQLFWGCIVGMFAFIVFLGLLFALLLRDRLYGYYSLYALFALLFLLSFEGILLEWFDWHSITMITALDFQHLATFMQVLFNTLFIRELFLPILLKRPLIKKLFTICLVLTAINLIAVLLNALLSGSFEEHSHWVNPIISFNYIATISLNTGTVLWIAFGNRELPGIYRQSARLYLLSITSLLILIIASFVRNYAFIPDHPVFQTHGMAIAMLSEFLLLSVGLGYRYKRIIEERHQLNEENYRQQQQVIQSKLRLQQQEVKALEAQIRLQQEKERIARDLHDHVGSQLSVIATSLDYPMATDGPTLQRVSLVSNYARGAIQSLRDTIWAIHQEQLSPLEFKIKLQQLIHLQQEFIPDSALLLRTDFQSDVTLSSGQALNLFRITQEALNNAMKYARASQIAVECSISSQAIVCLQIKDNGVGFMCLKEGDQPRYGLINMQHRARELGGECSIDSKPGQGTCVRVRVPLSP
jgi:two-component system, sensor histidine kinase LadS